MSLQPKKKNLRISTIRRAASKMAGVPGNLLINGVWFSSREWRNGLIGAGLSPDMTLVAFQGATIRYEELEITEALLAENGGEIKHMLQGREVTFKKAGVNNVNLEIDFSTVNVTDSTINLAKLSQMYPDRRNSAPAPQRAPQAPMTETTEDDLTQEITETGTGQAEEGTVEETVNNDLVDQNDQQGN